MSRRGPNRAASARATAVTTPAGNRAGSSAAALAGYKAEVGGGGGGRRFEGFSGGIIVEKRKLGKVDRNGRGFAIGETRALVGEGLPCTELEEAGINGVARFEGLWRLLGMGH